MPFSRRSGSRSWRSWHRTGAPRSPFTTPHARPRSVIALAFMEFIRPMRSWDDFRQLGPVRDLFQAFRTPGQGEKLILEDNVFVERVLLGSVLRRLSAEET